MRKMCLAGEYRAFFSTLFYVLSVIVHEYKTVQTTLLMT